MRMMFELKTCIMVLSCFAFHSTGVIFATIYAGCRQLSLTTSVILKVQIPTMVRKGKKVENNVAGDGGAATTCGVNQSRKEFMLGDIVWVKIHGSSWWPAQVVDENSRVGVKKTKKKMEGGILTRLYGSYDYMYVDPMKSQSEFENVLKQNNLSVKEILQKALEQENHASRKRKKRDHSLEHGDSDVRKKPKQNGVEKNHKVDGLLDSSQGASTRRMRVMQSLGLVAPIGSPFLRKSLRKKGR